MRRGTVRAAVVAVLGASTVAGCSATIMPAVPKAAAAPPATTATAAAKCHPVGNLIGACQRLGDLTTLDPCGLISVGALPADLGASPEGRESLDYCAFTITAGPNKGAELEIGELNSSESGHPGLYAAGSQNLGDNGLQLNEGTFGGGECDDAVQFGGDQVELEVNVFTVHGNGSQSLCDAANEVGHALGTVFEGTVQMQHFTVGKNSIARLKACGLLDGAQVGTYSLEGELEYPSGHYCWWRPDPNDYDHVQFGIELEIGSNVNADAADARSQIHGLPSYTFKDSENDHARCEVDTNRLPWGSASDNLVEIASVWAEQPAGQLDTACSLATQLAGIVWPKLPPLS